MPEEPGSRDIPELTQRRMPGRQPTRHPLARAGFIEYDRVIFFSDAVFAIAITLLAITLKVPNGAHVGSAHDLHEAIPGIFGFAISFLVIGLFWIGHHGIFRFITAVDRRLIAMNLAFLGVIAFLPYPTDLLSASNQTASVIFYATCCALAGLLTVVIWLYATRPDAGLASPDASQVRNLYLARMLRLPVVFLLSIPVAIVAPKEAPFVWLPIWLSGSLINRFWPGPDTPEPDASEEAD